TTHAAPVAAPSKPATLADSSRSVDEPAPPAATDDADSELAALTVREAMATAFDAIDDYDDVPAAIEWLKARGRTVDRSGAYKATKKLQAAREAAAPRLAVVGEDQ